MTYVREQTSAQLRAHMRALQKVNGWHNPLDDRLFSEVEAQDAEIERLLANQERMWCKACGTVTRDRQCDCTKFSDQDTQSLVNYADAMQKSAHEEAQENERLRAALKECAAEWKSGPGSVYECFNQARYEFLRRMEVARAALNHEQSAPEKQEG